jgi:enoyl-CoA hydratase
MSTDDVILERIGRAGVITLDRPRQLNALTHGMVTAIAAQLSAWAVDPAVTHVIVRGAGERAFCAGGDIRLIARQIEAGAFDDIDRFYRDEYRLNRLIKRFPKPYVALIDGIVMGGGVGISVHGSHRVGSDKLLFAMPEVGIGFFPDVGATYVLPRLPGRIGTWLALTGERLGLADAAHAGIVTHAVASADMEPLFKALTVAVDVDATLRLYRTKPADAPLKAKQARIDAALRGETLDDVLARIRAAAEAGDAVAQSIGATLAGRSPTSVAIAFEQMRRGGKLDFEQAMQLEYRIVSRIVRGHDFVEGVRALIIDKDNRPVWTPGTFEALDEAAVAAHFAALPGGDLDFA